MHEILLLTKLLVSGMAWRVAELRNGHGSVCDGGRSVCVCAWGMPVEEGWAMGWDA